MDLSIEDITDYLTSLWQRIRRYQFSNKAQLAFLEDFYTLINDGIPANRAIEMMASVTTGISREVALSIGKKISEGQSLAEGMRPWFAINIVEIVRVGEEGGVLVETLRSGIKTLEQQGSSMGAVLNACAYPLFVMVVACLVIVYLNNSVFTQFRLIKPVSAWPQAGQTMVELAQLIESWWWLVVVIAIALILVFKSIMNNYVGELRPMLDRIPPFSLYRRFVASRFLETLGLLITNGVVFKSALRVMQYQANPYLASHLVMMEHLLGTGKDNVSDALATGLVSDQDLLRLRVMAEVKGFEHGLTRMGIHGAEQNVKTLKLIARIIGGIFLTIDAFLIITIVKGIYLTGMAMGAT